MDLRKGSGVTEGKRRCIRCRGRKKLYKAMGGWCLDNSGGECVDCPMCLGKGIIDHISVDDLNLGCAIADIEEEKGPIYPLMEKKDEQRRRRKIKKLEKEY